jgi:acetate---CoA ligase (ADP-forming)
MTALERLLNPRGIAVVGASADAARPGAQAVHALEQHGYAGHVYPVNPKYREIGGKPCYASVRTIDGVCDVAVIALPAPAVPGVVGECADRGIPYAVVQGGGFRESGAEGAKLEAQLLAAARGKVRLIGPNCLGVVNVHTRAYAAFGSLTRPPRLRPGAVSAVFQSASFGMSIVAQCDAAGVGFRYVVSSGNEADIRAPELIGAYVDDPETGVILAYIEGVGDGRALMDAARRALAAGKPLIVLKAGNTEQGRRAAESHTANLTSDYDIYRAAFTQCGAIEVPDVQEAVDLAVCLGSGRLPRGRRVVVMGGSGGAAAMFSDRADEVGLVLPPLASGTLAVLETALPRLSSLKNPIDYTAGYPRAASGVDFERAFGAVLDDPGVDQLAVMFAAAGRSQLQYGGEVLAKVAGRSAKPIVVFSGMTETLAPEGHAILRAAGIPVLASPKRAATVMAAMARYAEARERSAQPARGAPSVAAPQLPSASGVLNEYDSKRVLAAAGIPVTRDVLLGLEPDERACNGLPYPVALKIVSPDLPHKTDVGGVRLGIASAGALRAAASSMVSAVQGRAPDARLDGLLASEMVSGGLEVIVGVVNDQAFGPVVAVGLGGIHAEVLRDMSYRVAPFGRDDAIAMLEELRAWSLFAGVRGGPAYDVTALAQALETISALAWALRDGLAEMDVNPLLVLPEGRGAIAADALVILK